MVFNVKIDEPCLIAEKQIWSYVSEWSEKLIINSDTEYREYRVQNHTKGRGTKLHEEFENFNWLIWYHGKLYTIDVAQRYCWDNENSELFEDIDGTQEQLMFLIEHMNEQTFWLGLIKTEGSFKTRDGVSKDDKIFWDIWAGEPSNTLAEVQLFVYIRDDWENKFPYLTHDFV